MRLFYTYRQQEGSHVFCGSSQAQIIKDENGNDKAIMKVHFPDLTNAIENNLQCPISLNCELFDREDYEIYKKEYLVCEFDWGIWDSGTLTCHKKMLEMQ